MADLVSVKLSGDALAGLDRLTEMLGENALRAAGYAGAKVFQEEAIANTDKFKDPTGVIKRNIIVKRIEEESDGAKKQTYRVVVRKGKMNVEGDAFYAGFVEFGHNIVRRKPTDKTWKAHRAAELLERGSSRVPARPFMTPAYYAGVRAALDAMRTRLAEKLKENGL